MLQAISRLQAQLRCGCVRQGDLRAGRGLASSISLTFDTAESRLSLLAECFSLWPDSRRCLVNFSCPWMNARPALSILPRGSYAADSAKEDSGVDARGKMDSDGDEILELSCGLALFFVGDSSVPTGRMVSEDDLGIFDSFFLSDPCKLADLSESTDRCLRTVFSTKGSDDGHGSDVGSEDGVEVV